MIFRRRHSVTGSDPHYSPGRLTWQRFRRQRGAYLALWGLVVMVLLALAADFLATSQPWYVQVKGKSYYPAFAVWWNTKAGAEMPGSGGRAHFEKYATIDWRTRQADHIVWAPIPYSPIFIDNGNRNFSSPGSEQICPQPNGIAPCPPRLRHVLGTNYLGQDVASILLHGIRISLQVGFISVGISLLIGLFLGSLAGYFGDSGIRLSCGRLVGIGIGLFLGFFYGFIVRGDHLTDAASESVSGFTWQILLSSVLLLAFTLTGFFLGIAIERLPGLRRRVAIPVDQLISRLLEVLDSLPRLLLILAIASLFRERSLSLVMAVIGLTTWSGIARLTRAEFLRQRSLTYVEALKALGLRDRRIIFNHILPNILAPVLIEAAFRMAGAIMIESSLSFLGVGVPPEAVSWGSLIGEGRDRIDAWWVIVFPGLMILWAVLSYNKIGEGLRKALNPNEA